MPACVAIGCTNRSCRKTPNLSFHRFPSEPQLRDAWILACRRKDWMPSSISVLCSLHFNSDDIFHTKSGRAFLKKNSVPYIFEAFPSYLKKSMMASCVAFGCNNRRDKPLPGISYHRFPTVEPNRSEWIRAVRRKNWQPTKNSTLCSAHFTDDCFYRHLSRVQIKSFAVPTIFNFPSHLQKTKKKPAKRNSAGVPKESATSTVMSETTPEEITTFIKEEIVIEDDDTVTSLPVSFPASGESVVENQAAVHLEPTDSIPSAIQSHGDTPTTPGKDHESRNLNQQLHELEGTVYKCYKIIKEPATSTVASMTSKKIITFSENGKCVLVNGDLITLLPASFPVPDESVLANAVLEASDTVPAVTKSCSDAATSPSRDCETEGLKQKLGKLEDTLIKYRKKIKVLHQENRRATRRATKYQNLFQDLKIEQEIKQYCTRNVLELPIEIVVTNTASENTECLKQQISKLKDKKDDCDTLSENES